MVVYLLLHFFFYHLLFKTLIMIIFVVCDLHVFNIYIVLHNLRFNSHCSNLLHYGGEKNGNENVNDFMFL